MEKMAHKSENTEDYSQTLSRDSKAVDATLEKAQLDSFRPLGKLLYEGLWQKSIGKEMNIISCKDRTKMMNANKPVINEKIEFKPGRKPKEAIEGDMIRFMYNDYDDGSVSWLEGRLLSRIDTLEDAVESE